jgi:uncharacterized membrane protein
LDPIINIFGHFHPLLVHLPIGILLFAILLHGLSYIKRFSNFEIILPFTYLIGAIAAILSCLSGLALSSNGEYDEQILFNHQWLGITVAIVSMVGAYFTKKQKTTISKWVSITLLGLLFITGHYGGTLTHGEGFLTKDATTQIKVATKPVITNTQEAFLYADIIQPILEEKCYGCHSKIKQKGKLRLDTKEWILKGGEDGIIIHNGTALNSPMYKRIILDPVDEKHMPPKGKPQITEQERILLEWWINSGGSFDKKIKELVQPANIAPILIALEKNTIKPLVNEEVPLIEIKPANQNSINQLTKIGVTILQVANNSNYLTANFITVVNSNDTIANLIKSVSANMVWLKMPRMHFINSVVDAIVLCDSLTRLNMEHSTITDDQLNKFKNLKRIHYLNLVGTKITLQGLLQLKGLNQLNELYLGETLINNKDSLLIQKAFPTAKIIFGNYRTQNLPSDTVVLKAPIKK